MTFIPLIIFTIFLIIEPCHAKYITNTTEAIKDDINALTNIKENTLQANENIKQAAHNLSETIYDTLTNQLDDNFITDYQGKIRNQELLLQTKLNPNIQKNYTNINEHHDNIKQTIESIAQQAIHANGLNTSISVQFYNEEDGLMGAHQNETIYINLAYQDGNIKSLITVLADELSHYVDQKLNKKPSTKRQEISFKYGSNVEKQAKNYVVNNQPINEHQFQQSINNFKTNQYNNQPQNINPLEKRIFIYNNHVVASDQMADDLVVDIDKNEHYKIQQTLYQDDQPLVQKIKKEFAKNNIFDKKKFIDDTNIIKLPNSYQTNGAVYNLNNANDFNKLQSLTDMHFNIQDNESNIYFHNGLMTNTSKSLQNSKQIELITNKKTNLIHNNTNTLISDLAEYSAPLKTKDILTAKIYSTIAKEDSNATIITHSAGNNDALKAMQILALDQQNLNNQLNIISLGSPISRESLTNAGNKVGVNIINQYNHKNDPVTNLSNLNGANYLNLINPIKNLNDYHPMSTYTTVYQDQLENDLKRLK